jgi:Bacterial capsule synthesis protein PGA_cap
MTPLARVLWESVSREPVVVRIAVAGDFLPAGAIAFPANCDWSGMVRDLAPCFDNVAISFVNLECPLDVDGLSARDLCGLGQTVSAPGTSLDYLAAIRAKIISISNNHIYDFATEGLERTRCALIRREMTPLGAGRSLQDVPEVFVWHAPDDIRVGFWAAAKASSDLARRNAPGAEPATVHRAQRALDEMKRRGAQYYVALIHAGCLRTNRPDPEDVALMDSFAALGFNLVAASHSHRVSGAKIMATAQDCASFCFYGLGSLVSGYAADPLEREGLVIVAGLDIRGNFARLEVHPILLGATGFGEIPGPKISEAILDRFHTLSEEISDHSFERLFYQDVSRGLLHLYSRDAKSAFRQAGIRGVVRKAGRLRMRHIRRLLHKAWA